MPTGEQIAAVLSQLSQGWWLLALWWHAYVAVFAIALIFGWRPPQRLAGLILALPLISVVSMAWVSANPFTTVVVGIVLTAALMLTARLPNKGVSFGTWPPVLVGALILLFGLVYPHFLGNVQLYTYVYASPLGIVPCPTLSAIVGLSLMLRSLESRSWGMIIGLTALFYGVFGALYLRVPIDWILSAGAIVLIVFSLRLPRERAPTSPEININENSEQRKAKV